MIKAVIESPSKTKRFRAIIDYNGVERKIDFGSKNAVTYIDKMRTKQERKNYWVRHLANKTEKKRIETLTLSPATLSAYILWGLSTSIEKNIKYLNKMLE